MLQNSFTSTTEIIIFEQKTDTITYITSPEGLTAIVVASSNRTGREWYWVFTDHLGSITSLVRNSDQYKIEMSYDAWGNRRDPATWENYNGNLPSFITDRGYTGHEHLDEFGLINMNGRVYDPQTTRFLSPDLVVADPSNPVGYNPYAYVLNNPLKYTDPSGYFVAHVIAGAIIYGSFAKQNADPKTGKWDWNFTNWFKKDRPGFTFGMITNTSFTSTTFFVSANFHNGTNSTFGYNTQYGWGSGSSPQDMYFPNHNSGASAAAAVNNIANAGNFNFSSSQGSYMDALIYNTMTKTIVLAFNQYHVVSSIGPLGSSHYGSDGGIYFANSTSGYEKMYPGGSPQSNSFELGPIGVGLSIEVGFPLWLTNRRVAFGYDLGIVADNTALGIGVYFTSKKPINNPLCFSVAPEVFYAHSAKNSQIKNKDLSGPGYEIMGSAGPIGATYGWDTRSTYRIISISGFGKGIDIGYGSWETNTKVFHFEDLFSK